MIAKFRRDCEIFAMVAKFAKISQCHSEKSCTPPFFLHSVQPPFLQFLLTFLHLGLMKSPKNSYEHGINRHRYEAKPEMMAEVPKTFKTTKNNLETKSVVLNGPVHVNWLNSYD